MVEHLKVEFSPLLPLGFHEMTLLSLHEICVARFPSSVTRSSIMAGLENIVDQLKYCRIKMSLWIDGSFMTEKLDPEDSDVVACISGKDFDAATQQQRLTIQRLVEADNKLPYVCDFYAFVEYEKGHRLAAQSEWMRAYWLRQFGFSRHDEPKGLAVVNLPVFAS